LEIDKGVPELVVNAQFTVVVEVILLPVEIKVNKTVDPEHTVNWLLLLYIGFVVKFAFNCPSTFNDRKQTTAKTTNLKRVERVFKSLIFISKLRKSFLRKNLSLLSFRLFKGSPILPYFFALWELVLQGKKHLKDGVELCVHVIKLLVKKLLSCGLITLIF